MTLTAKRRGRPPISIATQVQVLFRDRWLCYLCHRPTIFPSAIRLAGLLVQERNYELPIAYHDPRWRRDTAPLLDHLACVIDHRDAYSKGGAHEPLNFAVACNKCNVRKSAGEETRYLEQNPRRRVKSKYGEPQHWDGLASLFVVLARQRPEQLTATERVWLRELETHIRTRKVAAA